MKFSHQYDEGHPLIEVTLSSEATLGEVFEAFENFLKSCGYSFDGYIDVVENEEK